MDEDDKTIEHREAELTPKERRRFAKQAAIMGGVVVALFWLGTVYVDGWRSFDWLQIFLGAVTVFWVMGCLAMFTDLLKD